MEDASLDSGYDSKPVRKEGRGNQGSTLESESVNCSVVSDFLRPHEL